MSVDTVYFIWYLVYAFVQGICIARYVKERTSPGLLVFLCMVFAPIFTAVIIFQMLSEFIHWAVTDEWRKHD